MRITTNRLFVFILTSLLGACAMPERATGPVLYDFGPPASAQREARQAGSLNQGQGQALSLKVQATSALEGNGLIYRLAYAQAEQVRSYNLARWAMPPAELFQMRLRETLAPHFLLLNEGERSGRVLRIQILEFSQVFETPQQSAGQIQLTATLEDPRRAKPLIQRTFLVQKPAQTADARGGAIALTQASDDLATELLKWVQAQN